MSPAAQKDRTRCPVVATDRLIAGVLVVALLGAAAGCARATTTAVQIRDPSMVALRSSTEPSREVLSLGARPQGGVLLDGEFGPDRRPFRVEALRDQAGALSLRCDECAKAPYPFCHTTETLVDPQGRVSSGEREPSLTPSELLLDYDSCFARKKGRCYASAPARLAIPWENVAEARVRREPPRARGILAALGAFFLVDGGIAASPATSGLNGTTRVAVAVPLFTVGAALVGVGAWYLLAPAQEEILRPTQPPALSANRGEP